MTDYLELAHEFHVWIGEMNEDGHILPGTENVLTVCDLDDQPIVIFARDDILRLAQWLGDESDG